MNTELGEGFIALFGLLFIIFGQITAAGIVLGLLATINIVFGLLQ